MSSENPVVIMLVGLPGSGKTTWAKENLPHFIRISTDDHVMQKCRETGMYYQKGIQIFYEEADRLARQALSSAIERGENVVIDQANLTRNSREKKLANFPDTYTRIACFFDTPFDLLLERNEARQQAGEHYVPALALYQLAENLESPYEPAFDEVVEIPFAPTPQPVRAKING